MAGGFRSAVGTDPELEHPLRTDPVLEHPPGTDPALGCPDQHQGIVGDKVTRKISQPGFGKGLLEILIKSGLQLQVRISELDPPFLQDCKASLDRNPFYQKCP